MLIRSAAAQGPFVRKIACCQIMSGYNPTVLDASPQSSAPVIVYGRVGRFRRFTARTVDWLLVAAVVSYLFAGRATDVASHSLLSSGADVAQSAVERHAFNWADAFDAVRNSGIDAGQALLRDLVLSLLAGAVLYDIFATLALRTTVGKAVVLAKVSWGGDGARGFQGVIRVMTRSVLAVLPGGIAIGSWMLWLGGLKLTATAALLGGGMLLLIDGVVHLATGRPLHDRLTGTAVLNIRGPKPTSAPRPEPVST